jgi:hypothetical protein
MSKQPRKQFRFDGSRQKRFTVAVEKWLRVTGKVELLAASPEHAVNKVNALIISGQLQSTQVDWGEPEHEAGSFSTTGAVD